MKRFEQMQLSEQVLRAVQSLGFEEATPIQEQTIPVGLQDRDLIGQAPTGTGKTVAFGIPLVEKIDPSCKEIQAIVLTPTRELAIQVGEEINKLAHFRRLKALPIYGGQDIARQINALKKRPHIVVGTPGRVLDHIRRRTLKLQDVKIAVLDEADEMLDMGFLEDITAILEKAPPDRQTLLFSATIPEAIKRMARQFMQNPQLIQVNPKQLTVSSTDQHYVEVPEPKKFDVLCNLLDIHGPSSAIIFGRTRRRVAELAEALNTRGYSSDAIHGELTQPQRDAAMHRFREGSVEILVATDVAARGLDINNVTHVYNIDIPQDPESYVHRIGRTGRAGKSGMAITFITPREMPHLRLIEKLTKKRIKRLPVPTLNEALEGLQKIAVERLLRASREDAGNSAYRPIVEELVDDCDSITLLAAALRLLTGEPNTTPVAITHEKPLRIGHRSQDNQRRKGRNFHKGSRSQQSKGRRR